MNDGLVFMSGIISIAVLMGIYCFIDCMKIPNTILKKKKQTKNDIELLKESMGLLIEKVYRLERIINDNDK